MMKIKLMKHNNLLRMAGYTTDEEIEIYEGQLREIYDNPRWYLDNAYKLPEYRLSWVSYSAVNISQPRPKRKIYK